MSFDARRRNHIISADKTTDMRKRWVTTRGSLFRSYPRPRHECENQGRGRVSYSRITFATLESRKDTSFFSLSSFFSFVGAPQPSFLKHIFPRRRRRALYSFVYPAICMYNETGAFGQFPRVSIALRSVPLRKISVTNDAVKILRVEK